MRSFDDRDNSDHGWSVFLTGACLGAAGVYLLDPDRGARRRGVIRDQIIHAVHATADGLDAAGRDLAHRAQGTWAAAQSRFRSTDAPDHILIERVRTKLGRYVSHPRAIEVDAADGCVLLRGKILKREVEPLLSAVRAIPGVHEIDDLLERYETAGNIPSLQGGASRPGDRSEFMQREWSPDARAVAGSIGTALVLRAATNLEATRLVGVGAGRRPVDLQKTITVHAPLATVFDYWANFENFPQFMTHVREVRATNVEGQSHWVVAGPAHVPIEFDAVITQFVPNEVIAWKTVEGAPARANEDPD